MKIRRGPYSFLSTGILLFFVLHPVVAQADDVFTREDEEWFWHDRMMEQLRQPQQQPVRSAQQEFQECFNNVTNELPNWRALGLGEIVSALCKALAKGDYNTVWILTKRFADVLYSNNYFDGEAGRKKYLDSQAASMIQLFGWTPPEYR
ncbi:MULTISPECIES: hypothetical protein [Microcystis]|jgi:hypothetical protein|uniref:Uncharacterized protein n=1 Tax=Microcystis aeruginosa (strain NIES-843 / IAM M-2473) TaxID=449447 RepID=B0JII2_MICAN|nr:MULTISPECIES: hypothetical protein [Microcystis]MDJ0672341.1 hypothetical protein [Microcystis sp. M53598_WE2]BAG02480.1 unknown protein [Microcystis aeruginosa NIES-843]